MIDNTYRAYLNNLRSCQSEQDVVDCWFSIPPHLIDEEMCEVAVTKSGMLLDLVPRRFTTRRVCKAALSQDVLAWGYLSTAMRHDTELIHIAVQNGMPLDWVFPEDQTDYLKAIADSAEVQALPARQKCLLLTATGTLRS